MSFDVWRSGIISSVIMVFAACPAEKTNSTGSVASRVSARRSPSKANGFVFANASSFARETASILAIAASKRSPWSDTPVASTNRARFVAASSQPHPRAVSHGTPASFRGPTSATVTFASSAARAHPSMPFARHVSKSSSSGAPAGR